MTFEVGDLVRPKKSEEYVFKHYPDWPYKVLKIKYRTDGEAVGVFLDTGIKSSTWWYFRRFESAKFQYNPDQTGDTDEDI